MTNNAKISIKLAAVMLAIAFVVSALTIAVTALDISDSPNNVSVDYTTYYTASDILELSGVDIDEIEKSYLDRYIGVVLEYDDALHTATGNNVFISLEDGNLTVAARVYKYTAPCGIEISWIPVSAVFGERDTKEFVLNSDSYTLTFNNVTVDEESAEAKLSVEFRREFTVSKEKMSELINKAYHDAVAWDAYVTYIADKNAYDSELVRYEEYLRDKYVYDEQLNSYNAYLEELAAFESALARYNSYLIAMEEYKAAEELYGKYVDDLKKYEADTEAYTEYLTRTELLDNRLSALEATVIKMRDERSVYSAIMGNAVTEVLENKALITSQFIGVNKEVVNVAGRATSALRELLPKYFSLNTPKERYEYYTTNYESIRDNFVDLLRALDCLYANPKVRGAIVSEGRDWKFVILVAELSYIANALSDEPIESYAVHGVSPNYKSVIIDGNHTLIYQGEPIKISDVLENKTYMVDTGDADPDDGAYPDYMAEPVLPYEVTVPIRPERVDEPIAPNVIESPGTPPTEVAKPTAPTERLHPIADVDPTSPEVSALIDAYRSGTLRMRDITAQPLVVSATKKVDKKVFNRDKVNVAFYGYDGELLSVVNADKGSHVVFDGSPERPYDEAATYIFNYWAHYDTGERADLLSVDNDLMLRPIFRSVTRKYPITFSINGALLVVDAEYGKLPTCPVTPTKLEDNYFEYAFLGWDKEITAVNGACTYVAEFDAIPHVSADAPVSFEKSDAYYLIDVSAASDASFDVRRAMERARSSKFGMIFRTKEAEITITYSTLCEMLDAGDCLIGAFVKRESYGYTYSLAISGAQGAPRSQYSVKASVTAEGTSNIGAKLSCIDDTGERVSTPYTVDGGMLSFSMRSGCTYTYAAEQTVDVLRSELVDVSITSTVVHPGDVVSINVGIPDGVSLDRIYLKCSDGTEIDVNGREFVMPECDVLLVVSASYVEYNVVFTSGGRVIASYKCKYGDTVAPPTGVSKANDGTYSYTHLGWSSDSSNNLCEIAPVTKDVTYTAVYEQKPIPTSKGGFVITERIAKLLTTAAVVVLSVVIIAVIARIVSTAARRKRRRKRRIASYKLCKARYDKRH